MKNRIFRIGAALSMAVFLTNSAHTTELDFCYTRTYTDEFLNRNQEQILRSVQIAVFYRHKNELRNFIDSEMWRVNNLIEKKKEDGYRGNTYGIFRLSTAEARKIFSRRATQFNTFTSSSIKIFMIARLKDDPFSYLFTTDCLDNTDFEELPVGSLFCNTEMDGSMGRMHLLPKSEQKSTLEIPKFLDAKLVPIPPELLNPSAIGEFDPKEFYGKLDEVLRTYETDDGGIGRFKQIQDQDEDPNGYRYTVNKSDTCLSYDEYEAISELTWSF